MPNIPSNAVCLFLINVFKLKVESVEKAWKNVQVNSTIANHTLCCEKNVHKVLIIYIWEACQGTVWFGQCRN